MSEWKVNQDGSPILNENGEPIPVKSLADIIHNQEMQKKQFNNLIGKYVENGYIFVRSNPGLGYALFYHHANNEIQDDIVFVEVTLTKDNKIKDNRVLLSRSNLLKIAKEIKPIESLKQK